MRHYLSGLKNFSRQLFSGATSPLQPLHLEKGLSSNQPFLMEVAGGVVPLWLQQGTTDTLVVLFHGAVDKSKRTLPVFQPWLKLAGPQPYQLAISDPTLLLPGEFSAAWYAGHENFKTQSILTDILRQAIEFLGMKQVVFLGGSAGGFAALYYSRQFPDSYAIVAAPQTQLDSYSLSRKQAYRTAAWPSLPKGKPLSSVIDSDLCKLYAKSFPNNVIYLQSMGDQVHFSAHMAPFVTAISKNSGNRFILDCSYWGTPGHSGAIPPLLLNDWVRAIIAHPGFSAAELLEPFYALKDSRYLRHARNQQTISQSTVPAELPADSEFDAQDLIFADQLAASFLSKDQA